MGNIIILGILIIVIGLAMLYIYKEKKKGTRCIGCPSAGSCQSKNSRTPRCSCVECTPAMLASSNVHSCDPPEATTFQ